MKKNLLLICAAFVLCSCAATNNNNNTPDIEEWQEVTVASATATGTATGTTVAATGGAAVTTAVAAATEAAAGPAPTEAPTAAPEEPASEEAAQEATTAEGSAASPVNDRRRNEYPQVYKDEIKRLFDGLYQANDGCADVSYTLRDLDGDGVPELAVKHGTAEYDLITTIYTIDDNCSIKVLGDQLIGAHTTFGYETNSGQFVIKEGYMGTGSCTWISYVKGNEGVSVEKTVPVVYTDFDNYTAQMAAMSIADLPFTNVFSFDTEHDPKTYIYAADGSYEVYTGLDLRSVN